MLAHFNAIHDFVKASSDADGEVDDTTRDNHFADLLRVLPSMAALSHSVTDGTLLMNRLNAQEVFTDEQCRQLKSSVTARIRSGGAGGHVDTSRPAPGQSQHHDYIYNYLTNDRWRILMDSAVSNESRIDTIIDQMLEVGCDHFSENTKRLVVAIAVVASGCTVSPHVANGLIGKVKQSLELKRKLRDHAVRTMLVFPEQVQDFINLHQGLYKDDSPPVGCKLDIGTIKYTASPKFVPLRGTNKLLSQPADPNSVKSNPMGQYMDPATMMKMMPMMPMMMAMMQMRAQQQQQQRSNMMYADQMPNDFISFCGPSSSRQSDQCGQQFQHYGQQHVSHPPPLALTDGSTTPSPARTMSADSLRSAAEASLPESPSPSSLAAGGIHDLLKSAEQGIIKKRELAAEKKKAAAAALAAASAAAAPAAAITRPATVATDGVSLDAPVSVPAIHELLPKKKRRLTGKTACPAAAPATATTSTAAGPKKRGRPPKSAAPAARVSDAPLPAGSSRPTPSVDSCPEIPEFPHTLNGCNIYLCKSGINANKYRIVPFPPARYERYMSATEPDRATAWSTVVEYCMLSPADKHAAKRIRKS
jgi:hypothetical protein